MILFCIFSETVGYSERNTASYRCSPSSYTDLSNQVSKLSDAFFSSSNRFLCVETFIKMNL